MNSPLRLEAAVLVLAALAGPACAVRHPYSPVVPAAPATWATPVPAGTDDTQLAAWWGTFSDTGLSSLVERAVRANLDVKTALSRLRESRASVQSSRAALRPTVDASGSVRLSDVGSDVAPGQSYVLGLDASWEFDVFGGIRSGIDAAAATAQARAEDLRDVLVSLAAEVALDYVDLRAFQQRLEIARSNVNLQEQTLELTRFRQQAGLGTDLEVQQALTNVETTRAQIASLEAQAIQTVHAISVLLADPPGALAGELASTGPIPVAPVSVAVGLPADTLRRRPDVRSAERLLAAQAAQVSVAEADLYPSFRLAGSIGLESLSIAKLFLPGAGTWNVGPSVSTRLFNREQLRQNVTIQTERESQAALTYRSRVLSALQEVEDSLTGLAQEESRRDHLAAGADAAQQAADLSLQLYTAGLRDFRDVLDAQRSLLTLQDSLASSTASVSTGLVRLYKAVGGGWSTETLLPQ